MCVHKTWNLKYDTTEMTAATNDYCIGCDYLKIAVWWGRNKTFDSKKFKSIKGDFSDEVNG